MVIDLENYKVGKECDRVLELFTPVHDQLIEEGVDFLGRLYPILIDLVMRDYALNATTAEYDKGAGDVYDKTVAAMHKFVDARPYYPKRKKRA